MAPPLGIVTSAVIEWERFFDVDEDVFGHPGHAFIDGERCTAGHQIGPSDKGGVNALKEPVIYGQHGVLDGFFHEQLLHLFELGRDFSRPGRLPELKSFRVS